MKAKSKSKTKRRASKVAEPAPRRKPVVLPPPPVPPLTPEDPSSAFWKPIETDLLLMVFDIDNFTVTFTVKKVPPEHSEVLVATYRNLHTLKIVVGRIRKKPNSDYAKQIVGKARIKLLRQVPLG